VVSTAPAYLMNDKVEGVAVALLGKVPVKVVGMIRKGRSVDHGAERHSGSRQEGGRSKNWYYNRQSIGESQFSRHRHDLCICGKTINIGIWHT
jgi:hypothetical protein